MSCTDFSMTITLFHIIIPPIVACIGIVSVFLILHRARKRHEEDKSQDGPLPGGIMATGHAVKDALLVNGARDVDAAEVQKYISTHGYDERVAEYEKMLIKRIAANPRDMEAYDLLGQVYLVQGNMQDAAECFEQVVSHNPRNLRAVEQLRKVKKIMREAKRKARTQV